MKAIFRIIFSLLMMGTLMAQEAGTQKWTYDIGDFIFGAPDIGDDGTVYVASNDHYLYAFNSDGALKWKFDLGYGTYNTPAIGSDGTIYVGTAVMGKLYAINPDGTKKWESEQADGWIEDSPAIASDGTVIFGTSNQNFYGINADGSTRWKKQMNSNHYSSPAIAADGTIYMGFIYGTKFTAFNPDGSLKWQYDTGNVESSPAIGNDGTIYVASKSGILYALNPDGGLKWSFDSDSYFYASPVIDAQGIIYIGANNGYFYAINPDGSEKWHITFDNAFSSAFQHTDTPAIGADGTIYVASYDTTQYTFKKYLYAISPAGQIIWRFYGDAIQGPPAIAPDGTIYIGSQTGTLYAIHSNSPGLAKSAWPRFHHDNKGTGNVQNATTLQASNPHQPNRFAMAPLYPNPFNPSTHIRYYLPWRDRVHVEVYNAIGQKVATLFDGVQTSGNHLLNWRPKGLAGGVYYIAVGSRNQRIVRKALLIK